METMIAATLTTVGSLAMAVWQARAVRKESELLQGQWEVEPVLRLPNLRRDKAHQSLAPRSAVGAKSSSRKKAYVSFPLDSTRTSSTGTWVEEETADADWESAPSFEETSSAKTDKNSAEKVPLSSLKYGPCLLDTVTFTTWGALLGVFFLVGLLGPRINANVTQFNVLLIPLVTLALAATYPLPWAWAVLVVGCLQGANCLGYWLAGESFQSGDGNFCLAIYFLNALAVAVVSAFAMQRHRQMIVMKPE